MSLIHRRFARSVVAILAVAAASTGAARRAIAQPPPLPRPVGLVNDFADILPASTEQTLTRLVRIVRERSGGEVAVVTLADLGGRTPEETTLRIGREWGVGADSAIGSRARNAGTVILLVPKETSADGRGYCRIETGQGTEGFITDAMSGSICREATPFFREREYARGLELVTTRVVERYAAEFGFPLAPADVPQVRPVRPRSPGGSSGTGRLLVSIIMLLVFISIIGRGGRGGCLPFLIASSMGGPRYGGGHYGGGFGGSGGFGGGFGGGGFGGFGGGGGFSGGGGGSSW